MRKKNATDELAATLDAPLARQFVNEVAGLAMSHLHWKYRLLFRWLPGWLREKVEYKLAHELLDSFRWSCSTVLSDQGFLIRQNLYFDDRLPKACRN
jgi:hypothetical protein